MKIIEILPELDVGGVERHVIDLANTLAERGHSVTVISYGGRMMCQLSDKVDHRKLPVHKKNIVTGYLCARKIAKWVKEEGFELIHAHSRVPAWIAMWVASMAKIPFIVTAHVDFGTKTKCIYKPYRKANKTICVSSAVQEGMKKCFYDNTQVVLNGLDNPKVHWQKPEGETIKFLFVGRLSKIKGLHDALRALPQDSNWTLDVLGDGPIRSELEAEVKELNIENKVTFHGFSNEADKFMATSSCLLFPSYTEGMPLTLARAVQIGLPVLASDIPSVSEMARKHDGLLPPGDIEAWKKAIGDYIKTGVIPVSIPLESVPTLDKMVDEDEKIYKEILGK
ncbi:MAG: glycosyltransferase family 4 protein [Synergistaceae bacterium]